MAFPEDMVYTRLEFTWGSAEEIQVTGFWGLVDGASDVGFDWQDFVDAYAELVAIAWATNAPKDEFPSHVHFAQVVVYHYDQPHLNVLHRGNAVIPISGTGSWSGTDTVPLPPQDAVVASLYAYDPAGFATNRASKRGRMYLPTMGIGMCQADGTLGSSGPTAISAWLAAFLSDCMANVDVLPGETITNQVVVSSGKMAAAYPVTHVRVGQVFDTHRSRRNNLPETYVTVAL